MVGFLFFDKSWLGFGVNTLTRFLFFDKSWNGRIPATLSPPLGSGYGLQLKLRHSIVVREE
jgi:hypothetical protein